MTPCPAPLLSQRCARLRASETTVAPLSHPPRTQQLWRNRPPVLNHSEQLKPELYREAAERRRELARECPLSDIQGDLRDLATHFERMAVYMAVYYEAQRLLRAARDQAYGQAKETIYFRGCGRLSPVEHVIWQPC